MSESVDFQEAERILGQALLLGKMPDYHYRSRFSEKIQEIILGDHLTFRYILLTNVLALAANERIHPQALQKGSPLQGAYDARSLCHKVVVRFERQHSEAFDVLCDILSTVLQRSRKKIDGFDSKKTYTGNKSKLLKFIQETAKESHQGEICALLIGSLMHMLKPLYGDGYYVLVHPANQSGSSSNEISDIDIYQGPKLCYTIEVKDKRYTELDVDHAVKKVCKASFDQLIFIKGPQGLYTSSKEENENSLEEKYAAIGFDLSFLSLSEFSKNLISLAPDGYLERFLDGLAMFIKTARVKDSTKERILSCARLFGWVHAIEDG